MAAKRRHHFVPRFYLAAFADPVRPPGYDPFLWVRDIFTGNIAKRAPHNVATEIGFYGIDTSTGIDYQKVEDELGEIEDRSARALRDFVQKAGPHTEIPPDVGELIASLAARTPAFKEWVNTELAKQMRLAARDGIQGPELEFEAPESTHRAFNVRSSAQVDGSLAELLPLLATDDWEYRLTGQNWTDILRLQTWYFRNQLFPLLSWTVLTAPPGHSFVTSDAPVVFGADGILSRWPRELRRTSAELSVPLTPRIALVGSGRPLARSTRVPPSAINARTLSGATRFLIASSRAAVLGV